MDNDFVYGRVLLKLSGEALKGSSDSPYCGDSIKGLVDLLGSLVDAGVELAVVIGGGNIWRGAKSTDSTLNRGTADYMGMLATVMNAIYLRDALNHGGFSAEVQTSIPMMPVASPFCATTAKRSLEEGKIVIFAGGTGHPFFTTDTTAALRALEIDAEALLKATKVDGVYTDDPMTNPAAVRYEKISYDEALAKNLKVMDSTAFSLCRDNKLPIIVFNFSNPKNLEMVLQGDTSVATIVTD